jgi:hypothetical protein
MTGRPKLPETEARSIFISTRLSVGESQVIREAIKRSGMKKTEWVREELLRSARKK